MIMSKEALKLALEALEIVYINQPSNHFAEVITVVKKALAQPEHHTLTSRVNDVRFHKERDEQRAEAMKMLAQPEQEPVEKLKTSDVLLRCHRCGYSDKLTMQIEYTTPPQRTWVGLTDKEIQKMRHLIDWTAGWSYNTFARAVEAKLKEKNT